MRGFSVGKSEASKKTQTIRLGTKISIFYTYC